MTSAFAIILYIYLLSFGEQSLCNAQNNTENESELFKAVKDGKLCFPLRTNKLRHLNL